MDNGSQNRENSTAFNPPPPPKGRLTYVKNHSETSPSWYVLLLILLGKSGKKYRQAPLKI